LQGSAGAGILQVIEENSFFKQRSVYRALEKQARNNGLSSKDQALDDGADGPHEIAQERSRTPKFGNCLIVAGWDGSSRVPAKLFYLEQKGNNVNWGYCHAPPDGAPAWRRSGTATSSPTTPRTLADPS
jgi:hypothetical protein